MLVQPCGVYVSTADLRNAVSGASSVSNVSEETVSKLLSLMEQSWKGQDTVDVMLMAERFWSWQYEMTSEGNDPIKKFEFEVIMSRIQDEKLVPTVARRSDPKH